MNMPEAPNTPNPYGEFMRDLESRKLEVLPDGQIRDLIGITRSTTASDEQKAAARNQIIDSSLRMIPYVIKGLPKMRIPPEELVGESFETLNACIDNFQLDFISPKTENQVKFSSYVFESLKKKLSSPQSVIRVGEPIKIPVHSLPFVSAMRKARELFMQEEGYEPRHNEWYTRTLRFIDETRSPSAPLPHEDEFAAIEKARFTGASRIEKVAYRGNVDTDSLSPAIGTVEAIIADESADTAEEAIRNVLVQDVHGILPRLSPINRKVIELRFGIGLDEEGKPRMPMTFEAIGNIMKVSRERVRQIEARAMRRLRNPNISGHLRDYVESPASKTLDRPDLGLLAYKGDVDTIAWSVLESLNSSSIIVFFQKMRRGSIKDGRLDPELLKEILDKADIKKIVESEDKYFKFKSPSIMVNDIVERINEHFLPWAHHYARQDGGSGFRQWQYVDKISLGNKSSR